jgi:hypothetical protein
MIPSNPTFTTPLLSENVPPKAVKIKGAEYTSDDETIIAIIEIIFMHLLS